VYGPLPFTRAAGDAPNGPARLLLSGGGSLRGGLDDEGHSLVVGHDGTYRLVRTGNDVNAGDDLLLSPDGRYVAGDQLEGVDSPAMAGTALGLLDLITGLVRSVPAGLPVAWSPSGQLLVARYRPPGSADPGRGASAPDASAGAGPGDFRLGLLDVHTGDVRDLFSASTRPRGGSVAFSPDGTRLALQTTQGLTVYDLTTLARTPILTTSSTGRFAAVTPRLAGAGAWTPEGWLAVWTIDDAGDRAFSMTLRLIDPNHADPTDPNLRREVAFVDPRSGAVVPRIEPVTGVDAWLLGWQPDGDAVVEVFSTTRASPDFLHGDPIDQATRVELYAYHPGGGRTALVHLPADATRVDVPRDLVVNDRFGGPAPSLPARLGDLARTRVVELALLTLLITGTVTLVGWSRRRRPPRPPRPPRPRHPRPSGRPLWTVEPDDPAPGR
jgi:hypothetical protein